MLQPKQKQLEPMLVEKMKDVLDGFEGQSFNPDREAIAEMIHLAEELRYL